MKKLILIIVLFAICGSLSAQNNSSRKGKGKNYTTQIKELETELCEAYEKIAELEEIIVELQDKIVEKDKKINSAYVLIASKEDLKKKGIIISGQLIKRRLNNSNLDKKLFKSVDIRDCKSFNIPDESPEILTAMPIGSYMLAKTGHDSSVLEITDPVRFWAVSRYLIIMTH